LVSLLPPDLVPLIWRAAVPSKRSIDGGGAAGVLVAPMTGVVKESKVAFGHSVEPGKLVLI
jgi:biotin carboxyl carrier protein